jgi:hypothetical protein
MSVTIVQVEGPDDIREIYYRGTHNSDPRFQATRTVVRSALASGALDKDTEKAALAAEIESMYATYIATQE